MDDLVQWVSERLAEGIEKARWSGNMLITHGVPRLGVSLERAERDARLGVMEAEAQVALFEETVRPYLGTAGPTGRIAEQQLRLLALMHAREEGFREEWRL